MASTYLGPEKPAPFSVITERYASQLALPTGPEFDECRFGNVYEEEMFKLIHKYLELGTTDKLCYIGEERGSFEPLITRKFCLIHPVDTLTPPKIDTTSSPLDSYAPQGRGGYEDKLLKKASDCQACGKVAYDRVLLKDCLQQIQNPESTFKALKSCLVKDGSFLLIHRAGVMNTLPLFRNALKHDVDTDVDFLNIVKHLKAAGFDVQWEIEMVPVIMPKVKWLAMLRDYFPSQLEGTTKLEVKSGLRELSEGMFKYEGDLVEFTDRLLFVTATPVPEGVKGALVQRYGRAGLTAPPELDNKMKMEVDREISRLIRKQGGTKIEDTSTNHRLW